MVYWDLPVALVAVGLAVPFETLTSSSLRRFPPAGLPAGVSENCGGSAGLAADLACESAGLAADLASKGVNPDQVAASCKCNQLRYHARRVSWISDRGLSRRQRMKCTSTLRSGFDDLHCNLSGIWAQAPCAILDPIIR